MNRQHNGTATLSDVAAEAGVSLATASRALHGGARRVRENLKDRVLDAAKRLNYSANAQAQAMASGKTNVVGLVVHDIADPYFSSIAGGVMRAAEKHNLLVTLGSTARRAERELDYLAMLRGQRSRSVILAGSRVNDKELTEALRREVSAFQEAGGHIVAVSQHRLPVDTIVVENRAGARVLARELAGLGYRRFAVLAGATELITARDRVRGFSGGLAESSGRLVAMVDGPFTRDGGYAAMAELIAKRTKVDCVFAVNDVMAVGAMAACRDHGIVLPGDLAIAGFDDITTLRDVTPALTTVRLPLDQIGTMALDLVITASPDAKPRIRRVKGEVVLRASTPAR